MKTSLIFNILAMGSSSESSAVAMKLEGKVALITGGASGIGECTARLFCHHGAKVVIADIQDELGDSVCSDISPAASFVHCDVTNEDDVSKAVDHAVEKFGQLDIMFNNAGITGPPVTSTVDYPKTDFERVLGINLVGAFLGTKHAARVMIPARKGCIIATSSSASVSSGVASHAYTCSKHAIVGLTKNSAFELGRYGIRVNCVSPGGLATPLATGYVGLTDEQFEMAMEAVSNLKGVILKKEDIAKAVLFLASDDSRYVSGQNLVIDGAFSVGNGAIDVFK